jgi:hypothetical protein
MGRQAIAAARAGDMTGMKSHLTQMASSLKQDIADNLQKLNSEDGENKIVRVRLTKAARNVYHIPDEKKKEDAGSS